MSKRYYTYILSNKNDTTLYVGVTNDLERRVAEHRSGMIPGFTQLYSCHKLVYFEEYTDVLQAIAILAGDRYLAAPPSWHLQLSFISLAQRKRTKETSPPQGPPSR